MDINLARTFLTVAETGSFIDTARRMHVTQSTVSARIRGLENMLGRPLFERSKSGAELTSAGVQFRKHAMAFVRVWQHARLEVGLSSEHSDQLAIGAQTNFWDGFLLNWVAWMRKHIPEIAVSTRTGRAASLTQNLIEGTLDLAVMYRPTQISGLGVEHLFDEEFILVANTRTCENHTKSDDLVIDWHSDFRRDHAAAYPELKSSGLKLDPGSAGLTYILNNNASGYFPRRMVRTHLARGRLQEDKRARKFVYPVYMVYPEPRDEEAYEPILKGLRRTARRLVA